MRQPHHRQDSMTPPVNQLSGMPNGLDLKAIAAILERFFAAEYGWIPLPICDAYSIEYLLEAVIAPYTDQCCRCCGEQLVVQPVANAAAGPKDRVACCRCNCVYAFIRCDCSHSTLFRPDYDRSQVACTVCGATLR